jgi:tryptophanyl-tRNA synthetase
LTQYPAIPGIDGRKMSKSYGNDIRLVDSDEETTQKVRKMLTDPQKLRRGDPGRPDICPVFGLHTIYNDAFEEIRTNCTSGALGCVDCKLLMASKLNGALRSLRERRKELVNNRKYVINVLDKGAAEARHVAGQTMKEVREAMHLTRHDA